MEPKPTESWPKHASPALEGMTLPFTPELVPFSLYQIDAVGHTAQLEVPASHREAKYALVRGSVSLRVGAVSGVVCARRGGAPKTYWYAKVPLRYSPVVLFFVATSACCGWAYEGVWE